MNHLGHFKLSLVVFSLGLLFAVSEVFEGGEENSTIDVAAASVINEMTHQQQPSSAESWGTSTLDVRQFRNDGNSEHSIEAYRPPLPRPALGRATSWQQAAGGGTSPLPPPTFNMIHK